MKPEDFYNGLKTDEQQGEELTAAAEHFVRLKQQTGLAQHQEEQELEKMAGVNPMSVAIPAATAAAFGVGTYLRSRPQEDGKSHDENDARELAQGTKPTKSSGYLSKTRHNLATFSHDLAQTARQHPVKASATGAAGGALVGHTIAKLLGAGKNLK